MKVDCGLDERFYIFGVERIARDSVLLIFWEGLEFLNAQAFFEIDMESFRILAAPDKRRFFARAIEAEKFRVLFKDILPI